MPTPTRATFEDMESDQLSVSVSLVPSSNDSPYWVVKAQSKQCPAVIVFRKFAAIGVALGFASDVLSRGINAVGD